MAKKKSYDAVVLFGRSILIDGKNIFGIVMEKEELTDDQWKDLLASKRLYNYFLYLYGCSEWLKSGNSISDDSKFFIKGERKFDIHRGQVKQYCRKAYEKNPFTIHFIEDCNIKFAPDDIDDCLIISKDKYKECLQFIKKKND